MKRGYLSGYHFEWHETAKPSEGNRFKVVLWPKIEDNTCCQPVVAVVDSDRANNGSLRTSWARRRLWHLFCSVPWVVTENGVRIRRWQRRMRCRTEGDKKSINLFHIFSPVWIQQKWLRHPYTMLVYIRSRECLICCRRTMNGHWRNSRLTSCFLLLSMLFQRKKKHVLCALVYYLFRCWNVIRAQSLHEAHILERRVQVTGFVTF